LNVNTIVLYSNLFMMFLACGSSGSTRPTRFNHIAPRMTGRKRERFHRSRMFTIDDSASAAFVEAPGPSVRRDPRLDSNAECPPCDRKRPVKHGNRGATFGRLRGHSDSGS
jgi:hypothetical protein